MKKRINKKLTTTQAMIISIVFTIIMSTMIDIVGFVLLGDMLTTTLLLVVFVASLFEVGIWGMFLYMILLPNSINIKGKKKITETLKKEELIEIVCASPKTIQDEILQVLIQKTDCKLFAQLVKNDIIILIVKDKNNEEIYSCEITEYYEFLSKFKEKTD